MGLLVFFFFYFIWYFSDFLDSFSVAFEKVFYEHKSISFIIINIIFAIFSATKGSPCCWLRRCDGLDF